ncbi:MAG: tRNA (N6-isopentenyl adenosine(37)-C2)-methylthiotransferase MiaB [Oscillospiraceae bacterium]|nr:tRNA (N6-isopentenyl adenosine(37)-C2)-methylthiotransferase MiaB [Oscillospiraceae bacterium]
MISYADAVSELFKKKESPPLCLVRTFGCRQNVSDGEKISGLLLSMGFGFTEELSVADIIIYNTCAVRESAESRVFGLLGELKHLKEKNKSLIIGFCGCMADLEHIKDKLKSQYKFVDLFFGTNAIGELPKLLYEHIAKETPALDALVSDVAEIREDIPVKRLSGMKADVPVMYGCDNFCSYCIVPYVRGRERSRSADDIAAEVKELADCGFKEIMLLGQNVNSYGKGLSGEIDFPKLLHRLNKLDGDFKIRFLSSHPKDAGRELIDAIAECERVCKHLHLPIQSGSNRILSEMNRGYTVEQYLETVNYARKIMPGFSFSTDIIVGFPNETYEDFCQTIRVLEQVRFDNIFSFIYSKRKGTKAALLKDKTDKADKSAWFRQLLEKQREIAIENNKRFIGKVLELLVDGESETDGFVSGKSDEFINVTIPGGDKSLIGQRIKVKIVKAGISALEGKLDS